MALVEVVGQGCVQALHAPLFGTFGVVVGHVETGSLQDLVVEPHDEVPERKVDLEENEAGRYEVPVGRVQAVKDYIVVAR